MYLRSQLIPTKSIGIVTPIPIGIVGIKFFLAPLAGIGQRNCLQFYPVFMVQFNQLYGNIYILVFPSELTPCQYYGRLFNEKVNKKLSEKCIHLWHEKRMDIMGQGLCNIA